MKILTILGTRPEIIRLSRVIPGLDSHCKHLILHTGQNFDNKLNEIFFKELNVRKPDFFCRQAGRQYCEKYFFEYCCDKSSRCCQKHYQHNVSAD